MSEPTVLMEKLYSNEYYANTQEPDYPIEQVLKDINFTSHKGELWSVLGSSTFEIKLFLEIMANAKAYEKGTLMIAGLDTTKRKSTILPNIFYIGSTNMAYGNMNVLEYLMFITRYSKREAIDRQEYILNYLVDAQLGYISLTPISLLTIQEKSIVILVAAMLSKSMLIVLNLPTLHYSSKEINCIKELASRIEYLDKTIIISTECYQLAQKVSSHVCYIDKGRILYNGCLNNFLEYDAVSYLIGAENLDFTLQTLKYALPHFEYQILDNSLLVLASKESKQVDKQLFDALSAFHIEPTYVLKNSKNIKYSIQGLMRLHDLQ